MMDILDEWTPREEGSLHQDFIIYRLKMVYPALFQDEEIPPITPGTQAINQLIASIVTLVVALVGGALTGECYKSTKNLIITKKNFKKS